MKRSKVFLGLTTAILAVVGVTAAKHYSGAIRYYVTTGTTAACTKITGPCVQTVFSPEAAICTIKAPLGSVTVSRQLYTKSDCTSLLYYKVTEQ